MKNGITVNKTKLYHLAKECWPEWYQFPKMSECVFVKVTPFLYLLRWSGLKIELQFFRGEYILRYFDGISVQENVMFLHPLAIADYGIVKV